MIRELRIRNLAIIDELHLAFGPGLNVLTGETGAGKSIILGALRLVLGERAESDDVRTGADSAEVEALIDAALPPAARAALEAAALPEEPEGLLLRREVASEGRSKAVINGRLAPVRAMALLGRALVDIHGQHQHQSLLDPQSHLEALDAFADAGALARETAKAHEAWTASRRRLAGLRDDERALEREKSMLEFQVEEIQRAALQPGEEETLAAERARLRNAEQRRAAAGSLYALLEGGRGDIPGAVDLLRQAGEHAAVLERLDPSRKETAEGLADTIYRLQDLSEQLMAYSEAAMDDPARLSEIEDRLDSIQRLKKKYGGSVSEILEAGAAYVERLNALIHRDEEAARLQQDVEQKEAALARAAGTLSIKRKKAARELQKRLEKELGELQMEDARFHVEFHREAAGEGGVAFADGRFAVGANGVDRVEFLIATNPGEALKPLKKVASGGELSRIMLGLKSLLARQDSIPTLVFDEIDAGISGATAHIVAEKLRRLAEWRQILCITHLPQIASRATRHFHVDKTPQGGRATTVVRALDSEGRVAEIARLLGGDPTSSVGLRHARELLARSG